MISAASAVCALTLAACETGPSVSPGKDFALPAAKPGSAEATEALLPKVVEDFCMARLFDGVSESVAVTKLGLAQAANPIAAAEPAMPKKAWSTDATPRFHVWTGSYGDRSGCTMAIYDGDYDREIQTVLTTAERDRRRREGTAYVEPKSIPDYATVDRGWRTFFSIANGPLHTIYISTDRHDPRPARGLVVTIAKPN